MNNITEGYFMYEGLIIHAKILRCEGIPLSDWSSKYITEINQELYPYINYSNALYYASNLKIQSCEDIKGRSKGIRSTKKHIDKLIEKKESVKFRLNKNLVLNECIDYIFHKEPQKFKTSGYTHSGSVIIYDMYGNIKEEYFNNNFDYEGNRKIYTLKYNKSFLFQNLNYINGIQQGLQIEYYNDGKKLSEYTCDNGLIDGLKVTYYSTGRYAYSEIYEKGINKGYL